MSMLSKAARLYRLLRSDLKPFEVVDLLRHENAACAGEHEAMHWIILHSRIEGKKAPQHYFEALCKVIVSSQKKVIVSSQKIEREKITQDAVDAVRTIEPVLDHGKHILAAMDANKICRSHRKNGLQAAP